MNATSPETKRGDNVNSSAKNISSANEDAAESALDAWVDEAEQWANQQRECIRRAACFDDLLAALREAAEMLNVAEFPEGAHAVATARAAIARAEGQS